LKPEFWYALGMMASRYLLSPHNLIAAQSDSLLPRDWFT